MRLLRRKARRSENCEGLQLERVIGLTTNCSNGLACNIGSGDIAYLAGCVVVIYNVSLKKQVAFLVAPRSPKVLTCVAFSCGGKFIAAGESGHQPGVLVWESSTGSYLAELRTHKYGVSSVEFSPNGKQLVSLGFPHDGFLCVWDWRIATLLSKLRVTTVISPLNGIHFCMDGSFFVTAGTKHLKHWSVGPNAGRSRIPSAAGSFSLECKPINLGSLKESSFVALASAEVLKDGITESQPIYGLTDSGILCLLHCGLAVKKWVDLKVRRGYGLSVSETHIACACTNGIVRVFVVETLAFAATLPFPAPYGFHGLTNGAVCDTLSLKSVKGVIYPDAKACQFASVDKLVVIYADHSLFVWDVRNYTKVVKWAAYLSHNACIWDVANLPLVHKAIGEDSHDRKGSGSNMTAFATCSADGSIRLWCLEMERDTKHDLESPNQSQKNVYNNEIFGVIYSERIVDSAERQLSMESNEALDSTNGFRSIAVSPDGCVLAAGDRSGNLRVYDLNSLQLLGFQEAHEAEILTVSFGIAEGAVSAPDKESPDMLLLASGGRDRLVHIYDVNRGFDVIETLDDHSASITSVKFACKGSKLLSCSADKSVVFRNIEVGKDGLKSTRYHQEICSRGTVYDMDTDPSSKAVVTVGQDKKINVLNLDTGKSVKCFKPGGETGEPIKVRIDPSGSFILCSHSDKCMRLYDLASGEMLTQTSGHGEVITGLTFLPDYKRLISVSGDSCIFIWRLPGNVSKAIRRKCAALYGLPPLQNCINQMSPQNSYEEAILGGKCFEDGSVGTEAKGSDEGKEGSLSTPCISLPNSSSGLSAFKFSVSRLPSWAQMKVGQEFTIKQNGQMENSSFHSTDSKWAERLGPEGYKLFSTHQEDFTPPPTIRPIGIGARREGYIEGATGKEDTTPESSLDTQPDRTPISSPKGRSKETQWKTVHTVFFDEDDFFQEEVSSIVDPPPNERNTGKQLMAATPCGKQNTLIKEKSKPESSGSIEDGLVLYVSDEELKPPKQQIDGNVSKEGNNCNLIEHKVNELTPISEGRSSEFEKRRLDYVNDVHVSEECFSESWRYEDDEVDQNLEQALDESSEDDEAIEEGSPERDLFSTHFDQLSTVIKVHTGIGSASARSSFSSRFFSRTSLSLPRMVLFQDSPMMKLPPPVESQTSGNCINTETGISLATERERLKLRERQGKMAVEVQQMRERLVNLGISVAEAALIKGGSRKSNLNVCEMSESSTRECTNQDDQDVLQQTVVVIGEGGHQNQTTTLPSINYNNNVVPDASCKADMQKAGCVAEGYSQELVVSSSAATTMCTYSSICELEEANTVDLFEDEKHATLSEMPPLKFLDAHINSDTAQQIEVVRESIETHLNSSTQTPSSPREAELDNSKTSVQLCSGYSNLTDDIQTDFVSKKQQPMDPDATAQILPLGLPRPISEYRTSLQGLSNEAEKVAVLFNELQLMQVPLQDDSNGSSICNIFQEYVPGILQRVQELQDRLNSFGQSVAASKNLCPNGSITESFPSEHQSQRTSISDITDFSRRSLFLRRVLLGFFKAIIDTSSIAISHANLLSDGTLPFHSRPSTAASTESLLDSVDIEGFVQRYSVRFSETIASQILSMIQKGLTSSNE